jgi:hypothetical protein
MHDFNRHQFCDSGIDLDLGKIDGGNTVMLAKNLQKLILFDKTHLDEDASQMAALLLLNEESFLELFLRNDPSCREHFT